VKKTGLYLLARARALVFVSNGCASRALTFDNVSARRRFSIVYAQERFIFANGEKKRKERESNAANVCREILRNFFFKHFFSSERIENDTKVAGANHVLKRGREFGEM